MFERDVALIDDLRSQSSESSWLEFKQNNAAPGLLAKLCSALSNAARAEQKDFAYILWGIHDHDHRITGTTFDPEAAKHSGQPLQFWLAQRLTPSIAFSFRTVDHPGGRVVILEIPAATTAPVSVDGVSYIRIGSTTPKLSDYPDRFQKLMNNLRPFNWEKGIAKSFLEAEAVLDMLDYSVYFRLTDQIQPESNRSILERLEAEQLLTRDVGGRWNITNLGAILFATDLQLFDSAIARKAVRFAAYNGKHMAATVTHRWDGRQGYAAVFSELVTYINNLLPQNEHIGPVFREVQPLYPEISVREIIVNALIHQDMTITGAGPQIALFSDRLEITNPGQTLVATDRMIDGVPRSRNEAVASLMRRMKFCEEQGSGLDKVVISLELFQLPPLTLRSEGDSMQVTLYAPRPFAEMTVDERIRACYQHAVIKYLGKERMKNATLCARFGIEKRNAAQATQVIKATLNKGLIRVADPEHPRAGYIPEWA